MKYFVSSDIHGFYSEWIKALEEKQFNIEDPEHKLIVLGDLFDRGSEAKALQTFVMDLIERDKIILEIAEREKWIIDGTYHATLRTRLEKADLVIWLDYSTYAQLKGVIKRWFKNRGKEKPEIPGCKEQLTFEFLLLVYKFRKEKRQRIVDGLEGIDKNKVLIFKKQKDLNKWVKEQKERKN